MTAEDDRNIERDGDERAPGWLDRDEPYADIDVSELPAWWRNAVEEFRAHDLSPYRPPQFQDHVLVPPVVERLESSHGVEIQFRGVDVENGDDWRLYVDREPVVAVSRTRTAAGYTRYGITSNAFEQAVREATNATAERRDEP
ncbi:uncharacterized protein Nmag_2248 [Natrialba magadii ATCC 43099]|uniref:Uncharacterized protein n=1 Tax=Natrialba magadii (strain ATCC 43099 / DSM 3394 / CCM 3739 / CIP 104546 / IAM 13178 / JCM 8861 / NBRC 102185 / NCIMB 2190 / MS3) TaxID=547559 RepID=D3SWT1_NATMM|nr:hypothetical protein [Natrialba magadii]ADD05813.1 uncharacterized protein Nmag_2248 [Natrialba magadii ATCC 43099]ELY30111.1 hypothetical protein C500_09164 [Natrialba magadii ATCC 43099]